MDVFYDIHSGVMGRLKYQKKNNNICDSNNNKIN